MRIVSKAEMIQKFKQHLENITQQGQLFDSGTENAARNIAASLRAMLYNGMSPPAVTILKLGHLPFYDTSNSYNSKNLLGHAGLAMMMYTHPIGSTWVPPLDMRDNGRLTDFKNWWKKRVVLRNQEGATFTRESLVKNVATEELHFVDDLQEDYYRLSRENGLNFFSGPMGQVTPMSNPVPACIRQIGFEVLKTFQDVDIEKASKLHWKNDQQQTI